MIKVALQWYLSAKTFDVKHNYIKRRLRWAVRLSVYGYVTTSEVGHTSVCLRVCKMFWYGDNRYIFRKSTNDSYLIHSFWHIVTERVLFLTITSLPTWVNPSSFVHKDSMFLLRAAISASVNACVFGSTRDARFRFRLSITQMMLTAAKPMARVIVLSIPAYISTPEPSGR